MCRAFQGFEAAGFQHGVNCVVSEPDDLADLHFKLSAHADDYEAIARAGQSLILERHSVDARARDLSVILHAIASKDFHGSQWVEGRHVLRSPHKQSAA